jgi:Zn-dependent protease
MEWISTVYWLVILLFSVVIHEVMHGVVAEKLGDPTARYAGRITLNPLKHIDPFGSVILPILMVVTTGYSFGWAKPVPYNPYNLKPGRFSEAFVSGAGPASNLVLALLAGLIISTDVFPSVDGLMFIVVIVNVSLCIFNLIPIPPLDGSKVFEALLPRSLVDGYARWRATVEQYSFLGMALVLLIVFGAGNAYWSLIAKLSYLIMGL